MMKLRHPRLLRHISPSWWLCEALILLRSISLLIMKLFNQPRLLITHLYALNIHLTHRSHFLHSNYTIPLFMHWRSLTLQALVHDASYICFFRLLTCLSQECAFSSNLHVLSHKTMISPRTVHHAHVLTYVMWELWSMKCGCLHCHIFLVCWSAQLGYSPTKPSPTWVYQCTSVCIGSITSRDQALELLV